MKALGEPGPEEIAVRHAWIKPSAMTSGRVKTMQEVEIQPHQMDRFSDLLPADRIIRFADMAVEARSLTHGRVIRNVNATAQGGGVAEMLASARNASSRCISGLRPTGAISIQTSSPAP